MYYSGFADEAAGSLDGQIRITKELGWKNIESRGVDGTNLAYMPDAQFETMREKLDLSGMSIDCYGSAIANWGKDPRKEEDFQASLDELKRVIPRLQKLGTKQIRGMSFVIVKDAVPDSPEIEKQVFRKVRELVKICESGGLVYLHENCQNYGGMSWKHSLRLIEAANSPALRLVYDTGNPPGTDDFAMPAPRKKQGSFEFYSQVREFVDRVHVKDAVFIKETDGIFPDLKFTFPGEGDGEVERVLADLLKRNFPGAFSIEPHMAVVHHDNDKRSDDEVRWANYLEYGKRLMSLVERIRAKAG